MVISNNKQVISTNSDEYIHLTMIELYYHQIRDQVLEFSLGVKDMVEKGVRTNALFFPGA